METTTVLENFGFTRVVWHEVGEKIDYRPIEKLLNHSLHLSKYGNGLKQIVFTYIADYSEEFHQNQMEFDAENKVLYLSLRLDYDKVKNGTKEEVLKMMQDLYLASVFYYYGLGVRDFDFRAFYEAVRLVFS